MSTCPILVHRRFVKISVEGWTNQNHVVNWPLTWFHYIKTIAEYLQTVALISCGYIFCFLNKFVTCGMNHKLILHCISKNDKKKEHSLWFFSWHFSFCSNVFKIIDNVSRDGWRQFPRRSLGQSAGQHVGWSAEQCSERGDSWIQEWVQQWRRSHQQTVRGETEW